MNGSQQSTYRHSVDICCPTFCHFADPKGLKYCKVVSGGAKYLYVGRLAKVKEYYILKPGNLIGAQAPWHRIGNRQKGNLAWLLCCLVDAQRPMERDKPRFRYSFIIAMR